MPCGRAAGPLGRHAGAAGWRGAGVKLLMRYAFFSSSSQSCSPST
jgi:hypothetical protein